MNELNIKVPEGHEIDQENSDLSTGVIRFKETKQGLVKSWEDLGDVLVGWIASSALGATYSNHWNRDLYTDIWATKEQAEASIAMAMLSQLMKQANDGWTPDWTVGSETKYIINFIGEDITRDICKTYRLFLAFKSEEIRDEFLELHRDLIEKAKPLL